MYYPGPQVGYWCTQYKKKAGVGGRLQRVKMERTVPIRDGHEPVGSRLKFFHELGRFVVRKIGGSCPSLSHDPPTALCKIAGGSWGL